MKVDYGNILFPGDTPLPLPLDRIAGRAFPRAELEIGFGNGEFTAQRAALHPDTLLIGVEVSPSCVVRCARRADGFDNLKIVCTDARFMMKELFADETLDRVYMNFPCPWPKNRHARRRVTNPAFANDLAAVLKLGGVFELVTDEEWYAQSARSALAGHEALTPTSFEVDPVRPVTTKYERKWLEMGKHIYRTTLEKTAPFTLPRRTWAFYRGSSLPTEANTAFRRDEHEGVESMHVKTGKPLPPTAMTQLFDASGVCGEARWAFKKHYAAPGGEKAFLLETVSADDDFEQRYYIKIVERNGNTLVKLDATARVYLTPAVRLAVEDLGKRLAAAAECEGAVRE